jgi:glycosyltransferase involved in cell wall biosynthesis
MKIFYWSPFFSNIATIKAVFNSARSLIKFQKNNKYDVSIINSIGEWNNYKDISSEKIGFKDLTEKDLSKIIPRGGYLKSRFSYLFIFIINMKSLLKLINREKPDYLLIHLITSLPIFLSPFFNRKTKIILRLSGLPKLNILRILFWKLYSRRIYKVTCPTQSTLEKIIESKIFAKDKVHLLKDPIINIQEIKRKSNEKIDDEIINTKYILGIGRLTKQKNFELLLDFFAKLTKKDSTYKLYILGDGEDKTKLTNMINKHKLVSKALLLGHHENVFKYLKYAECFILSSLWEDPGFVLAEAAIMNTNIISSDCPNGPTEIVCDKDFLFTNGSSDDLLKKFDKYRNKTNKELFSQQLNVKKRTRSYTSFQHFKQLTLILN